MKHVRRLRRVVRLLHAQRRALLREVLVNCRLLRHASAQTPDRLERRHARWLDASRLAIRWCWPSTSAS